jgi:hypothetical protein
MDLRTLFAAASSSRSTAPSSDSEEDETLHPSSPKRQCTRPSTSDYSSSSASTTQRKYSKKWENEFPWLDYDENYQGAFCKVCRKSGSQSQTSQGSGGVWITKPFQNWKKAVQKMKAHAGSESHIRHLEAELTAKKGGSIVHQLQRIGEHERTKNRNAIKSFLRCTHFLCKQHIPHTTNFDKLINLIVSCGGKDLDEFVRQASKNASYTSSDAVTDFLEAIGIWVDESLVTQLLDAQYFSLLADECTDIANIEELSIYCRWEENGLPVEHFMEILPLKRCDAEFIYSTLIEWLKKKSIQCRKMVGMGFDGASTFAGKHSGVQARLKKHAPHAIFVHCHCHKLQLAIVQAANSTDRIKHVYTTLTTLWKFFYHSPKRCESLKEVQKVLNLPELKITKPSDTRWLAHERCVSAVKRSYGAIVTTLEQIYEGSHEPEALGLSKILRRSSTLFAIYLLDFLLPQVSKLSKCLQSQSLDLTIISSLVDATLHTLDDVIQPAANWLLELQEVMEEMESTLGIKFTTEDITEFQSRVVKPFYMLLKDNIQNRFNSHDIVSSFSIFDPKKMPKPPKDCSTYGNESIQTLLQHYGRELPAESVLGDEFVMPAFVRPDLPTEWKTFRRYITNQPKEGLSEQLKELSTNSMLQTMCPSLSALAKVCLTIPVGTASVERSFSQMKMIKTRLRNRLGEANLSHLMKIAIESPQTLSDEELEQIVDIWSRKSRRICV